jgi:hypothetical protein
MKKFFNFVAIGFVALVVIGMFADETEVVAETNQTNTTTVTQKSPRSMVWFEGNGDTESTKKQFLEGDYEVEWQTFGNCYYAADLSSGEDIFSADGALESKTYLYGVPAGNHFVEVITGPAPSCAWFITFRPI